MNAYEYPAKVSHTRVTAGPRGSGPRSLYTDGRCLGRKIISQLTHLISWQMQINFLLSCPKLTQDSRQAGPFIRAPRPPRECLVRMRNSETRLLWLQEMAAATKFSQDDWKTSNFLVSSSAERQRTAAHTIRQENHKISNHTGKEKQRSIVIY